MSGSATERGGASRHSLPRSDFDSHKLKLGYRWKGKLLRLQAADGVTAYYAQGYHRVHLPQSLGVGDNGTWRWKFLPIEVDVGGTAELGADEDGGSPVLEIEPLCRVRCRKWSRSHGVTVGLEALPQLGAHVRKAFSTPAGSFVVGLSTRQGNGGRCGVICEWRCGNWGCPEVRAGALSPCGLQGSLASHWQDGKQKDGSRLTPLSSPNPYLGMKGRWRPQKGCCVSTSFRTSPTTEGLEGRGNANCSIFVSPPPSPTTSAIGPVQISNRSRRFFPLSGQATAVGISVSLLGDRFGRDIESLDIIGAETQKWQLQGGNKPQREWTAAHSTRQIGVVAGHWIDPGDDTGAPGEREFNMEVADALHDKLHAQGWTVLRPDLDAKGLPWDDYLRWVARQSRRGTPVVEIHGQGLSAAIDGIATGVIGCRDAPINKALASSFGTFPMDWTRLAVPRQGGVIVESFVTDEVNKQSAEQQARTARQLAGRMSESIRKADAQVRSSTVQVESGCSTTGCPIGKYGHELEDEAQEKSMLEPSHPLAQSPLLKDSMALPEAGPWSGAR